MILIRRRIAAVINTVSSGRSKALGMPSVVMLGILLVAGTFTAPAASAATVAAMSSSNDRRIAEGVTLRRGGSRPRSPGPAGVSWGEAWGW